MTKKNQTASEVKKQMNKTAGRLKTVQSKEANTRKLRDDLKSVAENIEKLEEKNLQKMEKEREETSMENSTNERTGTLDRLRIKKESKSIQKNLKMTPSLNRELKEISEKEGISVNSLINEAIEEFIERYNAGLV